MHKRITSNHGLTRFTTARTWGKPSPSPLYYTMCLPMGPAPKCHFVSGLPSESFEIPKVGTPITLEAHNFVCRPPIKMTLKEKLYPLPKAFQWYVIRHLNTRKSGRFLTFSG